MSIEQVLIRVRVRHDVQDFELCDIVNPHPKRTCVLLDDIRKAFGRLEGNILSKIGSIHKNDIPKNYRLDITLPVLPKRRLVDGSAYFGYCRNANVAIWDAAKEVFRYKRRKFGNVFFEEIKHPEDYDGSDFFEPIEEIITPDDVEMNEEDTSELSS